MSTLDTTTTEYRELPLAVLVESPTNPRRSFDENALKEMAESVRTHGILSPLLVRPRNERSFEIVFGARRYRAAQMAEAATAPVRIKNMTDAEVLEAQLIENLQRESVHPMEEAQGFKALLNLEEPKYSIEQIAAKTGKSPAYVAQRVRLTELIEAVIEAFYRDDIGVGHALLLAKLPADKQEGALTACFQEEWSASRDRKAKRTLLPVRNLHSWIEQNILLVLKDAPFDKRDAHLVAIAGSCVDCANRTGHNKLLFSDLGRQDACTDPSCYQAKVDAHVAKTLADKPRLVQISTAYTKPQEGSTTLPRGKYVAILSRAIWRVPFHRRRCLIPADGFYEWKRVDAKTKQPYAFAMRTGEPFAFGGLWDGWKDPATGDWLQSFTIITTDPNELTATVHDRMPVILKPSDYDRWLDRSDVERPPIELLKPYEADKMEAHLVDPRVGNVRNDEPSLCDNWQCPPNSA